MSQKAETGETLLELSGIDKSFGSLKANDGIAFAIKRGEIHALLGENGAGKSTLVKIIYGVLQADSGEIRWDGAPVSVQGPAAARRMGIGMVFQHFSLFEAMTVLENVALSVSGFKDRMTLRQRIIDVSAAYGLPLDPDRHVHSLSVGERQRIEIVRCLLEAPKLLILDEPTSVLTPQEAEKLFVTLRQLAGEGCAILYISHKLDEVKALCSAATILRGGKVVADCNPREETARSMAELMIGEKVEPPWKTARIVNSDIRLSLSGLTVKSEAQFGVDLTDINVDVAVGEIVAIAGIAGNGQDELMAALSGENPVQAGMVTIDNQPVGDKNPAARRALGAAFVPEERIGHGAVPGLSLQDNAFLTAYRRLGLAPGGWIDQARSAAFTAKIIDKFDVRTGGIAALAGSLSGGNLQKFIVGREILQEPGVLVVAQPTWGVDAGAMAQIHRALLNMAQQGMAILIISQDLDEIFQLADRVAVIAGGQLSPLHDIHDLTVEAIGLMMGGETTGAAHAAVKSALQ